MIARIHVLTTDPSFFLVSSIAGDEFISEMVTELFGTRSDGTGYEWEAEEVDEQAHKIVVA
jgi:hypothetical protein